jgi:cytochrome c peroxidase
MSRMRLFLLPTLLAACAGGSSTSKVARVPDGPAGDCSATPAKHALTPQSVAQTQSSSGIALAQQDGRTLAFIADEDEQALHVLDVAARRELASVPLVGTPSHVLVASDGRVLVTLRDSAQVQVFTASDQGGGALSARCTVATPVEPIAIAETPDKSRFVVTSGWSHSLDVLSHHTLALKARVDLPREPRGVLIAPDGKSAIVSHLIGSSLSVVNLTTGALREIDTRGPSETHSINIRRPAVVPVSAQMAARTRAKSAKPLPSKPPALESATREATIRRHSLQGYALAMIDRNVVNPRVLVDPGEEDEVASYYGSGDRPADVADVLILDPTLTVANQADVRQNRRSVSPVDGEQGCQLPRSIAENTADHTALVACLGTNTLVEYAVESAGSAPRAVVRGKWPVAKGPIAVAYDAKQRQAIVWSQYDHAATFVALPAGSLEERLVPEKDRLTRMNLTRASSIEKAGEIELGRELYHTTNDHRISREGLACASCHPDGRDDALTWSTQEGPRNAPMLAGRLDGTAPYAWNGTSDDLSEHLKHTMQRLGGSGLSKRELEALASYCLAMKTYRLPVADERKVARGKDVFDSAQTQCSTCHAPGKANVFTDKKKHDVGSRAVIDNETTFDTPSLRFVGGTAPYFHDGRYQSLRELLVKTSGSMGKTAHLSPSDLDALEAYLRTL